MQKETTSSLVTEYLRLLGVVESIPTTTEEEHEFSDDALSGLFGEPVVRAVRPRRVRQDYRMAPTFQAFIDEHESAQEQPRPITPEEREERRQMMSAAMASIQASTSSPVMATGGTGRMTTSAVPPEPFTWPPLGSQSVENGTDTESLPEHTHVVNPLSREEW